MSDDAPRQRSSRARPGDPEGTTAAGPIAERFEEPSTPDSTSRATDGTPLAMTDVDPWRDDVVTAERLDGRATDPQHAAWAEHPQGTSAIDSEPHLREATTMGTTHTTGTTGTNQQRDVVDVILGQHQQVKRFFGGLDTATGDEARTFFDGLVHLLAVHETAEEEVVYPALSSFGEEGERVADARKHEEDEAKKALAQLESMGVDDPEFRARLLVLRSMVLAHAEREESEVVPLLRRLDTDKRAAMGRTFEVAEGVAPTHAHRMAPESAAGNLVMGPMVALIDRVRDAIRNHH